MTGGLVRLVIRDNGRGFYTELPRSGDRHGLPNLRSRAEAAGGLLTIASRPGQGTTLTAEIPAKENA